MKHAWKLFGVGALLFGAAVPAAAVPPPPSQDGALGCADYITTSFNDEPDTGYLIGTSTRTDRTEFEGGIGRFGGGGGETETWEVGYYEMSDGRRIRIDCRDYTLD